MGRLRMEPREKQMSHEEYHKTWAILQEARAAASDARVYYDLEEDESARGVRKSFQYVAEKEGLGLRIRRQRGSDALELIFDADAASETKEAPKRLSAEEGRSRILAVLKQAGEPMRRADVVSRAGISTGTWSLRIKELLEEGKVVKHGSMRDSSYSLA